MKTFLSFLMPLTASFIVLATACPAQPQTAQPQKGRVLIVGGGGTTNAIKERLLRDAGGPKKARMLIVPYADMKEGPKTAEAYRKYGCTNVDFMSCPPEEIDKPENLKKLDGVNVIYFSGGYQRILASALHGTRFLERIHQLHQAGATVGGTSAGAAVMSKVMIITRQHVLPKGKKSAAPGVIAEGHVNIGEGFGFVTGMIVDQHFIVRKRLPSLFSALLDHPDMLGVGIDEKTAIDVSPDGSFEVVGASSVMVFKPMFKQGERPRFDVQILQNGDRHTPPQTAPSVPLLKS